MVRLESITRICMMMLAGSNGQHAQAYPAIEQQRVELVGLDALLSGKSLELHWLKPPDILGKDIAPNAGVRRIDHYSIFVSID